MKELNYLKRISCIMFCCCGVLTYCQNQDAALLTNSVHYIVQQNKGIFGLFAT